MSDPFCQESLETPHSLDTTIEYSQSASSPFPIKEPGFLGNLDVPSLARGHKYEHEQIVCQIPRPENEMTLGMLPVFYLELLILDVKQTCLPPRFGTVTPVS